MTILDTLKRAAAEAALTYVSSNGAVGLGSGSTARYVVEGLAARLADGRLQNVAGVPTSEETATLARSLGVPLLTLDEAPELVVAIDGADQIDPALNLIKGLGAAMLREKIVASAARRMIVVADERKLVPAFDPRTPIPVEVVPFAKAVCARHLATLGLTPQLRLAADGQPVVTDEGNYILDCTFSPAADFASLDTAILTIPGVVEHGLFLHMASIAIIAGNGGIRTLTRTT